MSNINTSEIYKLIVPIKVGETEITQLTLNKPNTGQLRGCKLVDVLQMDVDAHAILIPRICNELSSSQLFMKLDTSDVVVVMSKVVGFFTPAVPAA